MGQAVPQPQQQQQQQQQKAPKQKKTQYKHVDTKQLESRCVRLCVWVCDRERKRKMSL